MSFPHFNMSFPHFFHILLIIYMIHCENFLQVHGCVYGFILRLFVGCWVGVGRVIVVLQGCYGVVMGCDYMMIVEKMWKSMLITCGKVLVCGGWW